MAIAVVQSIETVVTGAGSATAVLSSVASGNLILVYLAAFPGATLTATCTDSVANTYTQLFGQKDTTSGMMLFGWYAKNVAGGTITITVDPSGASSDITIVAVEVSGADITTPLDQNATPTRGNSTAPSVSVTTATNDEGYFAATSHGGTDRTITQAGGWTIIIEDEGGSTHMPISVIWQTVAAGTITASWTFGTGAVDWVAGLSSFKAATGGGTQNVTGTGEAVNTSHGAGSVVPGAASITGSGESVSTTHGAGTVASVSSLTGAGEIVSTTHGSGSVVPGAVTLTGGGEACSTLHGLGSVAVGAVTLAGAGEVVSTLHGLGSVAVGAVTLAGAGAPSITQHGTGGVSTAGSIVGVGEGVGVFGGSGAVSSHYGVSGGGEAVSTRHGAGSVVIITSITGSGEPVQVVHGVGFISTSNAIAGAGEVVSTQHGSGSVATVTSIAGFGEGVSTLHGLGSVLGEPNIAGAGEPVQVVHGSGVIIYGQTITGSGEEIVAQHGAGSIATSSLIDIVGTGEPVNTLHGAGFVTRQVMLIPVECR